MLYVIAAAVVVVAITIYILADEARQDAQADNDQDNDNRLGARYASYRYPAILSEVYDAAYRWYRI